MNKLAIPDLRSWNAGDGVTAERMNLLQDMMEFAMEPPECKMFRKATQSIASNGLCVYASFDNKVMDSCAAFGSPMWNSDFPTRFYARVAGVYEFHYSARFNAASEGGRRFLFLNPDGITSSNANSWMGTTETVAAGGGDQSEHMSGAFPWYMNVGQYVELGVYIDGGATSASLVSNTSESPDYRYAAQLHMRWVSI